MKKDFLRRVLFLVIAILVLAMFLCLVFVPHHHCHEPECQICATVSSYEGVVVTLILFAILGAFSYGGYILARRMCKDCTWNISNPVLLKVKLSD
jgi:hypothetical protein